MPNCNVFPALASGASLGETLSESQGRMTLDS